MEVRFFAGAAEAAGCDSTHLDATGLTADMVTSRLADGNEKLARILNVSTLLADGERVTNANLDLSDVKQLDVLPPFAGG